MATPARPTNLLDYIPGKNALSTEAWTDNTDLRLCPPKVAGIVPEFHSNKWILFHNHSLPHVVDSQWQA